MALLRHLPSVDAVLQHPETVALQGLYGRTLTIEILRDLLDETRSAIRFHEIQQAPETEDLIRAMAGRLESAAAPSLFPVINATGVIIHTNLGRAPLSHAALAAIAEVAKGYSNLEYDLDRGERGSRSVHAAELLRRLTGAEDALVVNNNAAAVLLMLSGLTAGREVIISRGQLVEIGGGFRIPEVMAQSGARLVEVGTTNRTNLADYERAISSETAAILVAHHSNYQIVGFTTEPTLPELAVLAREHSLPLLLDQGSGALLDTGQFGLMHEITVTEALQDGVQVVAFSGDKLLGGPQAGILCGQSDLLAGLKRHPLARAVRADKTCLAALSATLGHYLRDEALREIPVWQMIGRPLAAITAEAESWAAALRAQGIKAEIVEGHSRVGGGSLPGSALPTKLVALNNGNAQSLAARLRAVDPPVITRIQEDRLLLDPRTVLAQQGDVILQHLVAICGDNE
ncbi:MAG: L-seryl-tRNA(Sec) selenium transferase [Candidatus Promineifilaceae bacterium]